MMRCRWVLSALVCTLVATAAWPGPQDVTITVPTPYAPGQEGRHGDRDYGPPRVVDLASLDLHPESYQRAHVIVVGTLEPLGFGEYLTLREGGPSLLVIPGHEVTYGELSPLIGRRVEIRGILRRIRKKEYVRGVDLDLIEDPSLPLLPEIDPKLPRNSITVLGLSDRGESSRRTSASPASVIVRDVLEDPAEHAGKKVRLVGQFRGRNLFGDLPGASQRSRDDWVLKDGDTALWITGKEARGKGWALDPAYQGDTVRYVAVEGKLEVVNGVVYLRASKVTLAAKPEPPADDESP
ncbi:MAG TPA: hypothetical protein VI589_08420 [Vicinamibacteria bacterium]